MRLRELTEATITLYHGTSQSSAESLISHGWSPNQWSPSGNQGQTRYLYCTTVPEDARWFANEKGENTVVELRNVPLGYLVPDPEDATGETVAEELEIANRHGLPAKLALNQTLPADHFRIIVTEGMSTIRQFNKAEKSPLRITQDMLDNARGNKFQILAMIKPEDFILLTTPRDEVQAIHDHALNLRRYNRFAKNRQTIVHPFLRVEIQSETDGQITGHEGRHRAAALMAAGAKWMSVAIEMRPYRHGYKPKKYPNEYDPVYAMTAEDLPRFVWSQDYGDVKSAKDFAMPRHEWKIVNADYLGKDRRSRMSENASDLVKVYHVTRKSDVPAIMQHGLEPRIGQRSAMLGEPIPAIYVFTSMNDVEDGIMNWMGDEFEDDDPLSVLELTVPKSWVTSSIPGASDYWEHQIRQPVPPSYIQVAIDEA